MFCLKICANYPGQITNVFCDDEIVLHEPLNPASARPVMVIHPFRQCRLMIEGQPLLAPADQIVQMAPHIRQEHFSFSEAMRFSRGKDLLRNQIVERLDPIELSLIHI